MGFPIEASKAAFITMRTTSWKKMTNWKPLTTDAPRVTQARQASRGWCHVHHVPNGLCLLVLASHLALASQLVFGLVPRLAPCSLTRPKAYPNLRGLQASA